MGNGHVAQKQHPATRIGVKVVPVSIILHPSCWTPATYGTPVAARSCRHHLPATSDVPFHPHLLHQPSWGQLGFAMGCLPPGDLGLRVPWGLAGHSQALSQPHCQVAGLQLHGRWDAHQAVGWNLHQTEVREAWRLRTKQPPLSRTQKPLALFVYPAAKPVEGTVTAPWIIWQTERGRQSNVWKRKSKRDEIEWKRETDGKRYLASNWPLTAGTKEHEKEE